MLHHFNKLSEYKEKAYCILKVVSGLMFAFHGVQKLFGLWGSFQPAVGSQLWIGGIIELVTGLCIAFCIKTRIAAFFASGMMAVAYIQFHWQFQLGAQLIPVMNKGELALLYSVLFLYIACNGDCEKPTT